jgi:xanthine dehydrogenase accessory factor
LSISVGDVAAAALAVQQTGIPIAVILRVVEGVPSARMIVPSEGAARGTLGDAALDAAALELATECIASSNALSRVVHTGDVAHTLYAEAHVPTERLVVVGAGHIAVPLAALGVLLGFHVTVLDDREEFATEERFDENAHVLRADFTADPFAGVVIDERTYVALVTRGHRWDFDCLTRLLQSAVQPKYIGMIGSRRRTRAAFEALQAAAVPREKLALIHAPIGLDINADTPVEIAVSIAAEIVAVRRSGSASTAAAGLCPERTTTSLTERERVLERLLPEAE